MGHLALGHQVGEEPELFVGRHLGVDPVQLEQVDALEAEPAEAELALLAQVLGPTDRRPHAGPLTGEPGLGGDHQVLGVGVERFEDEPLTDLGTVGVGGVDEVDTHVDGPPQDGDALAPVGRLAPDARTGDLHGAEAEPVDGGGAVPTGAEGEGTARSDGLGGAEGVGHGGSWSRWGCSLWVVHATVGCVRRPVAARRRAVGATSVLPGGARRRVGVRTGQRRR